MSETHLWHKVDQRIFLWSNENDQGEDVSTLEIKEILQNIIEEEDKKNRFQMTN
jgi:RNA polymerase sigma-54 factor